MVTMAQLQALQGYSRASLMPQMSPAMTAMTPGAYLQSLAAAAGLGLLPHAAAPMPAAAAPMPAAAAAAPAAAAPAAAALSSSASAASAAASDRRASQPAPASRDAVAADLVAHGTWQLTFDEIVTAAEKAAEFANGSLVPSQTSSYYPTYDYVRLGYFGAAVASACWTRRMSDGDDPPTAAPAAFTVSTLSARSTPTSVPSYPRPLLPPIRTSFSIPLAFSLQCSQVAVKQAFKHHTDKLATYFKLRNKTGTSMEGEQKIM